MIEEPQPRVSDGFRVKIRAAIREMCQQGNGDFCIELKAIPLFNIPKYKLSAILKACAIEDIDYQWELVGENSNQVTAVATCAGAIKIVNHADDIRAEAKEIICEAVETYKGSVTPANSAGITTPEIMELLTAIREKIDDHGIGRRVDFTRETIRTYAKFLAECRNGKCPISQARIVTDAGELLEGAQVDHYYSREYNAIIGGWIVSSQENQKLRNPAYRATVNSRFLTFHEDMKQWIQSQQGQLFDNQNP